MAEHLILLAPAANRVYAAQTGRLVIGELVEMAMGFAIQGFAAGETTVGGVPYLSVQSDDDLDERMARVIAHLSASYALFRRVDGDLLAPVRLPGVERYPDDLVSIQKYQGKTNEQWTRLALNVTAAASEHRDKLLDGTLQVLDPMCGRGTTLNIALLLGLNVTGVDLDRKDFQAYSAFIKTWMRQHRLKHTVTEGALRTYGEGRGRRLDVEVAPTKEDFRAGAVQRVAYLSADTTDLDGLLKARSTDVIVTDTPYGVLHGSHGDRVARSPLELLDRALPGWHRVLRAGGAIGLSFNRHVAPRDELAALLTAHGFQPRNDDPDAFRHRVDASIDRDLLVATKVVPGTN